MVPVRETRAGGGGLFPAGTVIGWVAGSQTYAVRGFNVVSERLFIQPMLWGNWLYIL